MSAENLILNGDFSQGKEHWQIYKPNPKAKAGFRDGYCQVEWGVMVSQTVELDIGTYRLSFESLFREASESYVNLALEMTGYRQELKIQRGRDYSHRSIDFEVTEVAEGKKDWFSLGLNGHQAGGKFRKIKLVQIS
ncbi:hypothetical protein LOY52_12180 [Pseudomonas sp. B21-051]|uniref:hypothetical protein n=1 Tax=Pseudomonas sp. B21-051 TaxID=2895491 RepID=UPI00215F6934|nr:hypothetical protein [Pseudomonas sp. B21-051]UVK90787.1 hypothetical protein LOY52_12180 [Pseudomonas sp. B21-051]